MCEEPADLWGMKLSPVDQGYAEGPRPREAALGLNSVNLHSLNMRSLSASGGWCMGAFSWPWLWLPRAAPDCCLISCSSSALVHCTLGQLHRFFFSYGASNSLLAAYTVKCGMKENTAKAPLFPLPSTSRDCFVPLSLFALFPHI